MANATEMEDGKRGSSSASKPLRLAGVASLLLLGFLLGRLSVAPSLVVWLGPDEKLRHDAASEMPPPQTAFLIQATQPENDPRELLPLPGNPGQDGQGGGEGECPIYLYQDGQLFQFAPGQPGFPGDGGDQELFPLTPPAAPRTPSPPSFDGGDDVVDLPATLVMFQTP